jgi:hypothetical protein
MGIELSNHDRCRIERLAAPEATRKPVAVFLQVFAVCFRPWLDG